MTAKKIAVISREWPLDMLGGLAEKLTELVGEEGMGHVSDVSFMIDPERGQAIVDMIGEIGDGNIAINIFSGQLASGLQEDANDWLVEEKLDKIKARIARHEGWVYLLVVGRKIIR